MPLTPVNDVLAKIKASRSAHSADIRYTPDWKGRIPKWSRWQPGFPGNPYHEACEGTGYVRLEVSLDHPSFGKIFLCECVADMELKRFEATNASYKPAFLVNPDTGEQV